MINYQKFKISATDRFVPSDYPQLEESLQQVVQQLFTMPAAPKADMILSFVKDHSINSAQVEEHSGLADLISSQSLALQTMEAMFEASRHNSLFRKKLEEYIRAYFVSKNL